MKKFNTAISLDFEKKSPLKEALTILLFWTLVWGSILLSSGAVTSGYHLVDDHQIIFFAHKLSDVEFNVFDAIKECVSTDLKVRFRPFYYIHKMFIVSILHANFTAWQVYVCVLAVLSSFFFTLFARKNGFTLPESLLFPFLIFCGGQSEIWWRLGPAETIGIFLLSLALFFMCQSVYANTKKNIYNSSFILLSIIASLSKESFILSLPALAFWKVWIWKNHNEEKWTEAVRNNLYSILILLFVAVVEILIILLVLRKTDFGYAGVDGVNVTLLLNTFKSLMFRNGLGILVLIAVLIILLSRNVSKKNLFSSAISPIILLMMFCGPQIILYAKSGIFSRYMLPATIGLSAFILFLLQYARSEKLHFSKLIAFKQRKIQRIFFIMIVTTITLATAILFFKNRENPTIHGATLSLMLLGLFIITYHFQKPIKTQIANLLPAYRLVFVLSILTILYGIGILYADARQYAQEGIWTTKLLNKITSNSHESLLIVADPAYDYETSYSLFQYLKVLGNLENIVYYRSSSRREYDEFQQYLSKSFDSYIQSFGGKLSGDLQSIGTHDLILFLPGTEFLLSDTQVQLAQGKYKKQMVGNYLLFIRNLD
jgi:hypothetical protein